MKPEPAAESPWARDCALLLEWAEHRDLSPLESTAIRAAAELLEAEPASDHPFGGKPAVASLVFMSLGRAPQLDPASPERPSENR